MAEENFTLTTFYTSWKAYQDHIKGSLALLTAEQLELRAAPHLRSVGENALHIIGCRAGWFAHFLGEDCGADVKAYASWDEPGRPARTTAEIGRALDRTGQCMQTAWPVGAPTICGKLFPMTGMVSA